MSRRYSWNDIPVRPEDLWAFAWSAPMRDLAAKLDFSDVGLKKHLASQGVVPPPQGYWNKLRAGKRVPARPKPSPRQPGGTGRLLVDVRFGDVLARAEPLSSRGPFATSLVPESLDELYIQELKAIGRVAVSKTFDPVHKGLVHILTQEKRRQEKVTADTWHWDKPKFDSPLDRRRLGILNAVFFALSKRGHSGDA